ncbi:hypothetical protein PO909_017969 [Leuciscus waleckii]
MNRPSKYPADSMSLSAKRLLDSREQWWQSTISDTKSGKTPFPPQGEMSLRKYAQVVEERRFFIPEFLLNSYLIAGLNAPPPLAEREKLVCRSFSDMVDCLCRKEPQGPTVSSPPASLPVILEGRVLAVVTQGDQVRSTSTPEVSSAPHQHLYMGPMWV